MAKIVKFGILPTPITKTELTSDELIKACLDNNVKVLEASTNLSSSHDHRPIHFALKQGNSLILSLFFEREEIVWTEGMVYDGLIEAIRSGNTYMFVTLVKEIRKNHSGLLFDRGCEWLSQVMLCNNVAMVSKMLKYLKYDQSQLLEVGNDCPHKELAKMVMEWEL